MQARRLSVALVGNPNSGKTTLFNALSGLRQRVGNYPGVTVEMKKGRWRGATCSFDLIDLPGAYSLAARSPDETLAIDLLLGRTRGETRPDVIIAVVDASNLERHLYLVTQLFELGLPIVIALTKTDLAERNGLAVNCEVLSERIGVPVLPVIAPQRVGLDALAAAVCRAAAAAPPTPLQFPSNVESEIKQLSSRWPNLSEFFLRRLVFDINGAIETQCTADHGMSLQQQVRQIRDDLIRAGTPAPALEARTRYDWIRRNTESAITRTAKMPSTTDRFDRVLTHRIWGTLIFLAVMALVFQSIFTAAIPLMDWIKHGKDVLADSVRDHLPAGPFTSLLADGVIEGVGSVVVFLPQILILFGFLSVLEDCGYMARAAFLMDRIMSRVGLSGKSFIPLMSSVACAVPGIMATRTVEEPRDRLATILVAPLMSCSARLPVYTLLIAAFLTEGHPWWLPGLTLFLLYMIGFVTAPIVALVLKRTVLRGPPPAFIMEMPEFQWPAWRSVALRLFDRAKAFLVRAGTFILASMIIVWALLYFPSTDANGSSYDLKIAELSASAKAIDGDERQRVERQISELNGAWRRQSILGRVGQAIEPAVKPLGWDWRLGMAALASFPAREVMVGVLGQIFDLGRAEVDELREPLGQALKSATWNDDPHGLAVFSTATAMSVMVFFALCCQCASTLVVIRRETGSWKWPVFTFVYMTALAYLAALAVYQIGSRI